MYLIDEKYFVRDLAVPNIAPSLDVPGNELSFTEYIDKYSRQLLQNALGNVLFDELDAQIMNGELKSDADQKWQDLVNGKSYTYNDRNLKWKGLIFTEGAFNGSVLAYYTYYHWHLDQLSRMSGMGEVKGTAVNTVNVNSTQKSVKVWNEYVRLYQGTSQNDGYSFYYHRGVPVHDYYRQNESDYVSLLEFIDHHKTEFPDALLLIEQFQNTLGI